MHKFRLVALLVILPALFILSETAHGQPQKQQNHPSLRDELNEIDKESTVARRRPLRDLRALCLLCFLPEDFKTPGQAPDAFQNATKLRLRQSGIKVLSYEDTEASPTLPSLMLTVESFKNEEQLVYNVNLRLIEPVILEREPKVRINLSTWETGSYGVVGIDNRTQLQAITEGLFVEFLNAWSDENGK